MGERPLRIARGELRPGPDEPKVWFISTESFAKVLSDRNRALLAEIAADARPIARGAGGAHRPAEVDLSRTLKTLAGYGFVTLRRGERGRVMPEVAYIVLTLPLRREPGAVPEAA